MYTKRIQFEKYIPSLKTWTQTSFDVTDNSIWLHLQSLSLNKHVRKVEVVDLEAK